MCNLALGPRMSYPLMDCQDPSDVSEGGDVEFSWYRIKLVKLLHMTIQL